MSAPTVTEQSFEICEGRTTTPGHERPCIEGIVDGRTVVTAIDMRVDPSVPPRWHLCTFPDIAHFAGVAAPSAIRLVGDKDQIVQWVSLYAAMYAKAAAGQAVSL